MKELVEIHRLSVSNWTFWKGGGLLTQATKSKQNMRVYIKQNFLSVYKVKPLHQIFVSDLVKVCRIARGTFYFYYDNIEELYHECETDIINKMEENLNHVILCTVGADAEAFAREYAKLLGCYKNDVETYKCLLCGSEEASFRTAWFESIRRNYEKSMTFSRNTSSARRENLTRFFAGGILAILSNWVLNDCKAPAEEIASISAQVLFQGVFQ